MPLPLRIVTVTYNSAAVIGGFLESVPDEAEVVVVDNASTDNTCEIVRESRAKLVQMPNNQGFGSGCNAGAAGSSHPYLFFVNPDARIGPGCCEHLIEAAEAHPTAGAFNPAIRTPKGRIRLMRRSCLLPRSTYTPRSYATDDTSAEVHVLSGAAFFCRRDAFEAVGGFDPRIFLYHEDDDLSVRLAQAGWALRLEHGAEITHIGSGSSGYSPQSVALKAAAIAQSRLYVEGKHGIPLARLRAYLRGIGKVISPLSVLSGRKRLQARAYLKGVSDYDARRYGSTLG